MSSRSPTLFDMECPQISPTPDSTVATMPIRSPMPSFVIVASLALNSGGLFQEPGSGMNKNGRRTASDKASGLIRALRGQG